MGRGARRCIGIVVGLALALSLALVSGCRTPLGAQKAYRFFSPAPDGDAWSRKIRGWQERSRLDRPQADVAHAEEGPEPGSEVGELRNKFNAFRAEQRRAMARELAEWVQAQAPDHYRPDGPIDHWATLEETFRGNGDDCDGLELIAFNLLRELGFRDDEVFRAIVVRRTDQQHHMVTLWFEDPGDPWVIDPTGAMTSGMPRLSEVPEWAPLKVFSENRDFTVQSLAQSTTR